MSNWAERSLIDLAASRLGLRTPALRAAILRHIDSAKREHRLLRIPSLLMRARAQASARGKEDAIGAPSSFAVVIRSGCGLPVATGAVS